MVCGKLGISHKNFVVGGDHAGFHCRGIRGAHRVVSVFDI
jgi:hypothetical protein